MQEAIIQKIRVKEDQPIKKAMKYYDILFTLNDISIQKKMLQLVAFISIKGNISSGGARKEFIEQFDSSKAYLNNMISHLKRLHILVKEESGKIKLAPVLQIDFTHPLLLQINLENGN